MTQINRMIVSQNSLATISEFERSERQREVIEYLGSMIGQLAIMAKAERAQYLGYLLDMAYTEAWDILRGDRLADAGSPGQQGRRKKCPLPIPQDRAI